MRVLLYCTGKFSGSETSQVVLGNLLKSAHRARFTPASQSKIKAKLCKITVTRRPLVRYDFAPFINAFEEPSRDYRKGIIDE